MIFYQAMDGNQVYEIQTSLDEALADLPDVTDWVDQKGIMFSPSTGACIAVIYT